MNFFRQEHGTRRRRKDGEPCAPLNGRKLGDLNHIPYLSASYTKTFRFPMKQLLIWHLRSAHYRFDGLGLLPGHLCCAQRRDAGRIFRIIYYHVPSARWHLRFSPSAWRAPLVFWLRGTRTPAGRRSRCLGAGRSGSWRSVLHRGLTTGPSGDGAHGACGGPGTRG